MKTLVVIATLLATATVYAQTPIPLSPGTYQVFGPVTIVVASPTPTVAPTPTKAPTLSPTPVPISAPAGTPVPTAAPTPSLNDTVVMGTNGTIRDVAGNVCINVTGQITINGKIDPITSNVLELAYVNSVVWQENSGKLWWGKTSPRAQWLPAAGTSVSPITVGRRR